MDKDEARALLVILVIIATAFGVMFLWLSGMIYFERHNQIARSIIAGISLPMLGIFYVIYAAYRDSISYFLFQCWTWVSQFWNSQG